MTLSIKNLQIEYRYQPLFAPIDFTLSLGDCLQIYGTNGSGKSTLLKLIAGLLGPSSGSISWNGRTILIGDRPYQKQLHYLGHKNGLKLNLTVYENLKWLCALQMVPSDETFLMNILKSLGLEDLLHLQAFYLSAGQLRRLSFARLFITDRPLWILDEPTTSLDLAGQQLLVHLCKKHLAKKGTLIIATHQTLGLENTKSIYLSKGPSALGNITDHLNSALRPTDCPEGPSFETGPAGRRSHQSPSHVDFFEEHWQFSELLNSFFSILLADIKTTLRRAFSWATPLLFFIIVTCLFPIAVGPLPSVLHTVAPGVLWVSVLLAIIISIDHLFHYDLEEGVLTLLPFNTFPLPVWAFCKTLSHWLTHCLPLILIGPLLGFLLDLSARQERALIAALLLGTPVLSLLGTIGAALMTGIRSHGLLLPVLILPFYVPVLVFGTGTLAAGPGQLLGGHFALLGALLLISLAFAPLLTGAALRTGVHH